MHKNLNRTDVIQNNTHFLNNLDTNFYDKYKLPRNGNKISYT